MASPAWLASRVQVPKAVKLTTPKVMVQIEEEAAATVMTGTRPDEAVATGVYVAPPTVAAGAVEVKATVWLALATVTAWVTWAAAL